MQRPGEGAEVELRRDTLDHAAVRIDINHHRAPVGVADFDIQGEVRLVGAADALHYGLRFGLVDGLDDLLVAEQRSIVRGLAGAHWRVGQPDDLLADDGQGAGYTDDQHEKPDRQCQPAMDQEPDL